MGSAKVANNWASEASPTLGCSIEISRDIYICRYVCMYVCLSYVKSVSGRKIRPYNSFRLYARAALVWTEEKRSLRNDKLKANRAS